MWLFLTVVTAIGWGVASVLTKRAMVSVSPTWANAASGAVGLVVLVPIALAVGGTLALWPLLPVALFAALCFLAEYYVLTRGPLARTGTILSAYPVVTVGLAVGLLGEQLTPVAIGGTITILGGIILLTLDGSDHPTGPAARDWLAWALGGAGALGVGDFLDKLMTDHSGPATALLTTSVAWFVVTLTVVLLDRPRPPRAGQDHGYLIARQVAFAGGTATFFFALASGPVSLVVPTAASYAAVTAVIALTWLHERLTRPQLAGLVATVAGVVIISVT